MIWNPKRECMSRDEMQTLQSERLKKQVKRVYENVTYYHDKMKVIGLEPGDIGGIEDIHKLPFTTKDDFREQYPYGMFAVPKEKIIRFHASSGTTGKPKLVGYTKNDLSMWKECMARVLTMAGIEKNDVVQDSFGYGIFTGGLGIHYGVEKIGAAVIPASVGNTKRQIEYLEDLESTVIACTPSYLHHLIQEMDKAHKLDKIKLKIAICGAELWSNELRRWMEECIKIKIFDIYGLSEIMGPGVAQECMYQNGLHIHEDYFFPEILHINDKSRCSEEESGELVITTLSKEALPLIRYQTKDISSISYRACECHRTSARLSRIKSRADDMIIVRGVNVFPTQIETVLLKFEELTKNFEMIVSKNGEYDQLVIQAEVYQEYFSKEKEQVENLRRHIAEELHSVLGIHVKCVFVNENTLGFSHEKASRVVDLRK